ncbi:maleate cis-trans isomerase family protein [Roseovarius phycicola]|uniref:Arylmalonate decarboxylase n=1 Tax=Roseovarius phycicola TaxID=3080976 RepID=A0ABZ2HMP4_9RHOB
MTDVSQVAEPKTFQSSAVGDDIVLDNGPGKYRIGLIVLSNDYTVERDFMNMRPNDDVAIFTTRIANTPDCTVNSLRKMAPRIADATELLVPEGHLSTIAYACTSGSVVIGYDAISDHIKSVRPEATCITPITASLAALDTFGAQKLAVLTPYVDEVNAVIADYLQTAGKQVCAFSSFRIEDNEDMAALTGEAIFQAALKSDRADADALFISCTAIRAVEVVDRIEQALGKPVVTANQAMFWQALRAAGCDASVEGYGKLLRQF